MSNDNNTPRYEFRAFAQSFGLVEQRIRAAATCSEFVHETLDTYIVTRAVDSTNIKIRDDALDVKVLVAEKQRFEQWAPSCKAEFPIDAALLREELFRPLQVDVPEMNRDSYTMSALLDELIWPRLDMRIARVFKRRLHFTIDDVMTEIGHLQINGAAIATVAVESSDLDAAVGLRDRLGLGAYENVNYVVALQRTMGLARLPNMVLG